MTLKKSVAELRDLVAPDDPSQWVSNLWTKYDQQRAPAVQLWGEVTNYIFATDTSQTKNNKLPWTHSAVFPKLCQIRDNLHSNYLSSLFPNDKWLTWMAYSKEAAKGNKAKIMQGYMENKTREGGYRDVVSRLLYDYIDYGNCFTMPTFEARYKETPLERTPAFIGPRAVRISPYDIVFDPTVASFEDSWKIVRSWKSVGELQKLARENPDQKFWEKAVERREWIHRQTQGINESDWQKAQQYLVDGFGSLSEYYKSNTVEVLEFYGDWYNSYTKQYEYNRMVTIIDRSEVIRNVPIPSYGGEALIRHAGWRFRPDNLWAQGPLENLVGLQYMIDHYLNMGANALDLKVIPPKKIIGEVEEFVWGPNEEIHIDENGDVQEMAQQYGDIYTVRDWIEMLESRMELYAGAPREAMGMRSPGEKTAFEVQALENAASRIFQEKITQFEMFMEKSLNDMLEVSHRNFDFQDVVRVIDKDLGAQEFIEITKDDISANGILRPIGARHFARKANELQNIVGIFSSPIGQMVAPHTSGVGMTKFVEDVVDLRGYNLFRPNIALEEQAETMALQQQLQEDMDVRAQSSEEEIMMQNAQRGGGNEEVPTE